MSQKQYCLQINFCRIGQYRLRGDREVEISIDSRRILRSGHLYSGRGSIILPYLAHKNSYGANKWRKKGWNWPNSDSQWPFGEMQLERKKNQYGIIWKIQKPHYFKNVDVVKIGVIWKSNWKAGMTFTIFENWLHDFDKQITKQGWNIFIILDDTPCHLYDTQLKNVKLQILSPYTVFKTQLLNQEFIHCFKLEYRYFLWNIISLIDESKKCVWHCEIYECTWCQSLISAQVN